jgi:hypothetical protein
MTTSELKQLIKEVAEEEISMDAIRKAMAARRTTAVPFPGYNTSSSELPYNVKTFYNNFKRSISIHNIDPKKMSKDDVLSQLDEILTKEGFK